MWVEIDDLVERHRAALRDVIAASDMGPTGPYATVSDPRKFSEARGVLEPTPERKALHDALMEQHLSTFENVSYERRAIVMAGPPGAGKGHVQAEQLGGVPGFVVCDPDAFKELLIAHELESGGLDSMTSPRMRDYAAQGERFAPMEFATQIHAESSYLNERFQDRMLSQGANVVFDTVLNGKAGAEKLAQRLEGQGYTFGVVSVQCSAQASAQGIAGRWESKYRAFLAGKDGLGGRPVPSEFARSVFPESGERSVPEQSADWMRANATGCSEYRLYRRGEGQGHRLEEHLKKTATGRWEDALRAPVNDRQRLNFPRNVQQRGVNRDPGLGR